MKCLTQTKYIWIMVMVLFICQTSMKTLAQTKQLWVGESYTCDASSLVNGSTFNVSWSTNGGYLDLSGTGFYRKVTATQYWQGSVTVTCSWSYQLYYNGPITKTSTSWTFSCRDNPLSIFPSEMTLAVGQYDYVGIAHAYENQYTDYSKSYYTCSNKCVSVDYYGRVTGIKPGTEYVYAYSKLSNPLNVPRCKVTVTKVDPTSATVTSPVSVEVEKSKTLSVTLLPQYATSDSKVWSIVSGSQYISLTADGVVTGKWPGRAVVVCTVNGNIVSNQAIVEVTEPLMQNNSISPATQTIDVSVFAQPYATFSVNVLAADEFSNIRLIEKESGLLVEGSCSIDGNKVTFGPKHPLKPLTEYQFIIPANSLKSKYESYYATTISSTFTTGDLSKLSLTASIPSGFISRGESVTLSSSISNAEIHYTTDGQTPTKTSSLYSIPILLEEDTHLKAIAICEGYYDSDVMEADYVISNMSIAKRFPSENALFIYDDLNPYVAFSNAIVAGNNIGSVTLRKDGIINIDGHVVVADSMVFFVPQNPLLLGCSYTMTIPADAVKSWQGEPNGDISWSFTTGDFVTSIAAGGPELVTAIKMDSQLFTWGRLFSTGNASIGKVVFNNQPIPKSFQNDVKHVSSGLMHQALIKSDNSLWMWGRQYCGEFGNNSVEGSSVPLKIMDGVASVSAGGQSTAIVKTDGSLWMCGRNDYGQIGDSSCIVRKTPVKILDNVYEAVTGWCSSYAIRNDRTLWSWGRNDHHQLGDGTIKETWMPHLVMDEVAHVYATPNKSKWIAALKTDGSLWIWGDSLALPSKIMDGVTCASIGTNYVLAVKTDKTLWAFGDNSLGQFGNGTMVDATEPILINTIDFVDSVANAGNTSFALKHNGSVWAWGSNAHGLIGNGDTASVVLYPLPIEIIKGRPYSKLTNLSARKDTFLVVKGKQNVIDALPKPLSSVYQSMDWASEDDNIVSVSSRGVVDGNNLGETDVTCFIRDERGNTYSLTSHVVVLTEEEYWDRIDVQNPSSNKLLGDVNIDGAINITDVMMIIQYIIDHEVENFHSENADVNQDGSISITDVIEIISIIIHK